MKSIVHCVNFTSLWSPYTQSNNRVNKLINELSLCETKIVIVSNIKVARKESNV